MAGTAPWAVPSPRRARHLIWVGLPRRRELIAVCAVAILVLHLVFAQLTLLLAVVFAVVSKVSKWRMWWLFLPVAAGLGWTIAAGPGNAIAGFIAGPSNILWHLAGGHLAGRATQPFAGFGGVQHWLPPQLPVALVGGAAEAALIGWLDWLHTDEWAVAPKRAGLIAAARRVIATRSVRAGAVVTREGCALGVATGTGAVAELRWAEAVHGTLVVGAAGRDVTLAGLQVLHAALRRRKPVIVFDLGGDAAIASAVDAACLATAVPLRVAAPPETVGSPTAAGHPAHGAGASRPAIKEADAAGASGLWGRGAATESRPSAPAPADLGRILRQREAALVTADTPDKAGRALAELASLARDLRRIGVDGDALVWVPRGERVPVAALAELLGQAPEAGFSILVGTTSPATVDELSALMGTLLIHRVADQEMAASLAARTGIRLLPRSLAGSGYVAGGAPSGMERGMAPGTAPAGFAADVIAPLDPAPASEAPVGGRPADAAPFARQPVGPPPVGTGFPRTGFPGAGFPDTLTAAPDLNLVPSPLVGARTLLTLGRSEFVLAVSRPRQRIIAPGLMVLARLPHTAEEALGHQPGRQPGRQAGFLTRSKAAAQTWRGTRRPPGGWGASL